MSPMHSRVAAGVAAFLFATAVADITMAVAQQAPQAPSAESKVIATTCGAGTKNACSTAPIITCDFKFSVGATKEKGFTFDIGWTDCKATGSVPIYKDHDGDDHLLSGSCDLLGVFLGMPHGSGCSD